MGGSSDSKKKNKKADEPQAQATYSQPSFLPGMDTMLAQQLSMGGYGDPNSLLAAFSPIFTPMAIPDMRPSATPAPTPSTPAPTPSNPSNPTGNYVGRGRQPRRAR
jgi:hypothetical protein